MVFKMNGFNSPTDPPGRSKEEEIKHDIEELKKDIAEHSQNPDAVKKLREALERNKQELVSIKRQTGAYKAAGGGL